MPSKSKSKGNALERDVRDILNNVYGTEEFARTPNSGAIMGLSNYERNQGLSESTKATLGSDLICPDWFKFAVECKSYADKPNYAAIIKGPDTDLDCWLGEACFDARNLGLNPMLVFKTNRKGIHVAIPSMMWSQLELEFYLMYRHFLIISMDTFEMNAVRISTEADHKLKNGDTDFWLKCQKTEFLIELMLNKKGKK